MTQEPRHFWINTVSKDHVLVGRGGGFTQADHGKNTRLKHLRRGDYVVFYSPKTHYKTGDALQAFTALGCISDDAPFQVRMTPNFKPWRRKMNFVDAQEVLIRPLIDDLGFIQNKRAWGYPFRRGLFSVPQVDFVKIARAMNVQLELNLS